MRSLIAMLALMPMAPVDLRADITATGTIVDDDSALGFGWQIDETTVGLAPFGLTCGGLPVYAGANPVPNGSTISQVRFTGAVDFSNGSIVVEKSCFQPTAGTGGTPLTKTDYEGSPTLPVTIRDSEYDGSLVSAADIGFTAAFWGCANFERNYIHDLGTGGPAMYGCGTTLTILIEHNYVTDMRYGGNPVQHIDNFTIRDFDTRTTPSRTITVRNNWFDGNEFQATTGAFFVQPSGHTEHVGNVTIQGNYLTGGGWELLIEGSSAGVDNVAITNNRFGGSADGGFGACTVDQGAGAIDWTESENYIYHPTNPNNAGATVTC